MNTLLHFNFISNASTHGWAAQLAARWYAECARDENYSNFERLLFRFSVLFLSGEILDVETCDSAINYRPRKRVKIVNNRIGDDGTSWSVDSGRFAIFFLVIIAHIPKIFNNSQQEVERQQQICKNTRKKIDHCSCDVLSLTNSSCMRWPPNGWIFSLEFWLTRASTNSTVEKRRRKRSENFF